MTPAKSKSRSGTVLICVLACLGIVMTLVMCIMQSSLRGRREVRMQRQLVQTEFLCEAGVQRAIKQSNRLPDYRGEKWYPALGNKSFEYVAVEIRMEPSKEDGNEMMAEVIATLASSPASNDRMQRSHKFNIRLSTSITEAKQ